MSEPSPDAMGHQSQQAAAGWYPTGNGQQRYWDGTAWTEHLAPAPPSVPGAPPPAPGSMPLETAGQPQDGTGLAVFAHLGGWIGSYLIPGIGGFIAPAIVYLSNKDTNPYLRHHGAESLNWQVSIFIYLIVSVLSLFVLIGFLLVPVLLVFDLVVSIRGAMAAARGQSYRYPLCIRLFR